MRSARLCLLLLLMCLPAPQFAQPAIADREFPAHKVVGNVYFVGSDTHSSFLVTTPQGHVLVNTMYERTVPWIRKSVQSLGFRFEDIRIVLGSHAHVDHMEGDALVKQMTGATVMVMDRDVPLLERLRPGGKVHPVDRVLRHGDQVSLGGTTLVAHLTPGHTPGCTTWQMTTVDDGRTYDVVMIGCIAPNARTVLLNNQEYPQVVEDFQKSYAFLRTLRPDVYLGSHTVHYNMAEKHARLGKGANPFIDPKGYFAAIDRYEMEFNDALARQREGAPR